MDGLELPESNYSSCQFVRQNGSRAARADAGAPLDPSQTALAAAAAERSDGSVWVGSVLGPFTFRWLSWLACDAKWDGWAKALLLISRSILCTVIILSSSELPENAALNYDFWSFYLKRVSNIWRQPTFISTSFGSSLVAWLTLSLGRSWPFPEHPWTPLQRTWPPDLHHVKFTLKIY